MMKRLSLSGTLFSFFICGMLWNVVHYQKSLSSLTISTTSWLSSVNMSNSSSFAAKTPNNDMCKIFDEIDLSLDSEEGKINLRYVPYNMQEDPSPFVENLCQDAFDLYYAGGEDGNSLTLASKEFRHKVRPLILGTEHCQAMRDINGPNLRIAIAGMFNTGTNAFVRNLQANIGIPGHENEAISKSSEASLNDYEINQNGIDYQVPWWKHHPDITNSSFPLHRDPSNHSHILPIVLVRDPLNWMQSTCRSRYDLSWHQDSTIRRRLGYRRPHVTKNRKSTIKISAAVCPKAGFLDPSNNQTVTSPVRFNLHEILLESTTFTQTVERNGKNLTKLMKRQPKIRQYESLYHLWNEFYIQYYTADFPRLVVRFEDTMYLFPQVLEEIRQCVNGYRKANTTEQNLKNGKSHGGHSNLWTALRKNSDANVRLQTVSSPSEMEYARFVLDSSMMKDFHYVMP
jgi:hypothetical protein